MKYSRFNLHWMLVEQVHLIRHFKETHYKLWINAIITDIKLEYQLFCFLNFIYIYVCVQTLKYLETFKNILIFLITIFHSHSLNIRKQDPRKTYFLINSLVYIRYQLSAWHCKTMNMFYIFHEGVWKKTYDFYQFSWVLEAGLGKKIK